jgi:hypothetical protein
MLAQLGIAGFSLGERVAQQGIEPEAEQRPGGATSLPGAGATATIAWYSTVCKVKRRPTAEITRFRPTRTDRGQSRNNAVAAIATGAARHRAAGRPRCLGCRCHVLSPRLVAAHHVQSARGGVHLCTGGVCGDWCRGARRDPQAARGAAQCASHDPPRAPPRSAAPACPPMHWPAAGHGLPGRATRSGQGCAVCRPQAVH